MPATVVRAARGRVHLAGGLVVKQLLHIPTVRARELAANGQQDDYVAALEALYGIQVEQPQAGPLPPSARWITSNCTSKAATQTAFKWPQPVPERLGGP